MIARTLIHREIAHRLSRTVLGSAPARCAAMLPLIVMLGILLRSDPGFGPGVLDTLGLRAWVKRPAGEACTLSCRACRFWTGPYVSGLNERSATVRADAALYTTRFSKRGR